jgi:C-terminal processing protease CtpA/Prc
MSTFSEPFVLLEDQAGFVNRNREFEFSLEGQVIGPVEQISEQTLSYHLILPEAPQATLLDVDNDGEEDQGVMVFSVAYWSNTWGDPFLEPRDGTGWSNAYASTITDPERDDEIIGGTLVVWAPDNQQAFPSGFGDDKMLFTEDDPTAPISAGYTLVDLDQDPFRFYKERHPEITLTEGEVAVNDYSDLSYKEAFDALFEKVSREYPFTELKRIDWDSLYETYAPHVAEAANPREFYEALHDFTLAIPDGHVGVGPINPDVFYPQFGGGFGLVLDELSDGTILVTQVLPNYPAARAGIEVGAEIITWTGQPVAEALQEVEPFFGPYSTDHHQRRGQLLFLPRTENGNQVEVTFNNPGQEAKTQTLQSEVEVDSLFAALEREESDELALPLEGEVLDDSGLGYIVINTFSDDYNHMARLWEHYIDSLLENEIPGLIIDLRTNNGGNSQLALDFAGYLFEEEITLSRSAYYNENTGQFEFENLPRKIEPGPRYYDGKVAVLVGPECISACEGFAYALSYNGRSIVVGHAPTAGAYGEVGRGQYKLPDDLSLQFPTSRTVTQDGEILIEGTGVIPDIEVPRTRDSALGREDTVLQAAVNALSD